MLTPSRGSVERVPAMIAAQSTAPFDAVFFDLDGTLADSAADIRHALQRAFGDIGVEPRGDVSALVDGSPLEEMFAVAVPHGSAELMARFVAAYRRHYESGLTRHTRLYPGVRETLDVLTALRPRLQLAVATSKRTTTACALLSALGIVEMFDHVAGSGAAPTPPKPAPDLLLAIAAQLRLAPERVLVVGDTVRDVVAGRRAGMRTAAVTYGLGAIDGLLDARPDYVLEEFDELLVLLGMRA
jgi:HAD superfamily hydrolase (TIGR01509 family)